jgi:hypothetical protein
MPNWSALSEDDRNDMENKVVASLNSIGIKGAVARWNMPAELPHWQLIIETSWCASKAPNDVARSRDQAMARAGIYAPMNGVILKSPQEK